MLQPNLEAGPYPRVKNVVLANNGVNIRLYSISWFRALTWLSLQTIRSWQRKKILPRPYFTVTGHVRWYTAMELALYTQIITNHYQSGRDLIYLKGQLANAYLKVKEAYTKITPQSSPALFRLQNEASLVATFRGNSLARQVVAKKKLYA